MTTRDFILERTSHLPPELLENLSPIARSDMERWSQLMPHYLAMSKETCCVWYKGKPLFVAGALQPTLLDPTRELWMYASQELNAQMARDLKALFDEWKQYQRGPIYARSDSPCKARFLRFFGLKHVLTEGQIETYEVPL